jgi:MFS family permease
VNGEQPASRWYEGITSYQWLVLVVASLGWVFDVFEGQIFVASMNEAMPSLMPADVRAMPGEARLEHEAYYKDITLGAFLLGGAVGGVLFGILSDRIGRKRALTLTIGVYSAFTFLSSLSGSWWHMAAFRFLVALGVGGEWAVAAALVAEVFPQRARARSLAVFHASSVLGTFLAVAVGFFIVAVPAVSLPWPLSSARRQIHIEGWRLGFALGVVPALLILWIRRSVHEPASWVRARTTPLADLERHWDGMRALFAASLRRQTLVGVGLAAVGLATFWGTHIYGKDLLRKAREAAYLAELDAAARRAEHGEEQDRAALLQRYARPLQQWEMVGMFLVTTGGGLGLVSFGPICERLGRRRAFLLFHLGGLGASLILFQLPWGLPFLLVLLPAFGFLTLGMHAGYAVYFPELFPTRLRSTGSGFCFNMGRTLAAPALFVTGWLQKSWHLSLSDAASLVSLLFAAGALLLLVAPETIGHELPE